MDRQQRGGTGEKKRPSTGGIGSRADGEREEDVTEERMLVLRVEVASSRARKAAELVDQ
jgi:hypothetical protein